LKLQTIAKQCRWKNETVNCTLLSGKIMIDRKKKRLLSNKQFKSSLCIIFHFILAGKAVINMQLVILVRYIFLQETVI